MVGNRLQSVINKKLPVEVGTEILRLLKKHEVLDLLEDEINNFVAAEIKGIYCRIGERIENDKDYLIKRGVIKL